MDEKPKMYLTKYLVDKAGGLKEVERLFDYQYEVVIIPDAYKTARPGDNSQK